MPGRVVLAMSGGVDSSVAAYLLKEQGYEVIGLFMRTGVHAHEDHDAGKAHKKGCCSAVDAGDARRVADRLDIPFYALDFEADFARIMDYFVDEYVQGRTPNPCVVCNTWLKFGKLWSYGKQLGADFVATGHYARLVNEEGQPQLHRGSDPAKDQSYVLFGLRRSLLPHLLFPIGGYAKEEVRAIARSARLGIAEKPDSVEICFVPDNDHAGFIKKRRPELATAGHIVDTAGKVLASHDGIENFTIGQRKGFGFGSAGRRYVLAIVPQTNEVVIGEKEELRAGRLHAERVNWLIDRPSEPLSCEVKIRYRHAPAQARVEATADGRVRVEFEEPQSAITPGQAVVFYDGSRVLGGGWIEGDCYSTTHVSPLLNS
jgi:tRNA-specific 2-thiouridylase